MDCSPSDSSVHGISQQEYWSGLPFPSPEDCPDSGIKPMSPALVGGFFTIEPPGKLNDDLIVEKTKGSYGKLLYVQFLSTTMN